MSLFFPHVTPTFMHVQSFVRLFKDSSKALQKLCVLIKYLKKMSNHDVTFTYLSSDCEIHKLSASWLSIPQKVSIIWTAVSEVWSTIPSSSNRSLGSQMLHPYWPRDPWNQELTCRIHLLLPMSCSFTNRVEKKPFGLPCPPSLLLPVLNGGFGYTRSLCRHYHWFLH